ncbi:hypothetical protein ACSQ76_03035 [Roseovarius sp. B08]|uniref:hypothetical protein n=1 Tax=Roseovarius sp. B08 TaxID=3449223 RepID=UPI003EDBB932
MIYDDDGYYLASVLAELAVQTGREVVFVTPSPVVAPWTDNTLEQERIQARLIELGVTIIPLHKVAEGDGSTLELACVYSDARRQVPCATLVPVTSRVPNDGLWTGLKDREAEWASAGIKAVTRIGDCFCPGTIAAAVHAGHAFARTVTGAQVDPPRRGERVDLSPEQ